MSATTRISDRARQPWFLRKSAYIIISIFGAAAFLMGVDIEKIVSAQDVVEQFLPALLSFVGGLAASKANPGADAGAIPVREATRAEQPDVGDLVEKAASVALQLALERLNAPGAHRADQNESLEDLRASMSIPDAQ